MKKINHTRKKGTQAVGLLLIIGISVYIGFTPLFELVNGGVAGAVIGASFGAIFVIILTMYLLNKQTEIEQESKKSERVFEEKVELYKNIIENSRKMYSDGKISADELSILPFELIKLQMMAADNIIESYLEFFKKMNSIYSSSEDEEVELTDEDRHEIVSDLSNFAKLCRQDLGIEEELLPADLFNQSISVIEESSDALSGKNQSANAGYVEEDGFYKKLELRGVESSIIDLLSKMLTAIKTEFNEDKFAIDFVATSEKSTPAVSLKVSCDGPSRYSSIKINKKFLRIDAVPLMEDFEFKRIKISENFYFNHTKKHDFDRESNTLTGVKKYFGGTSSNNIERLSENEIESWIKLCKRIVDYRESGKSKNLSSWVKKAEAGDEKSINKIESILSSDYFQFSSAN
tara:strand:- start:243 stop:1454 length:1212 start_codon:yes stop_codon:yes gene_type:complete